MKHKIKIIFKHNETLNTNSPIHRSIHTLQSHNITLTITQVKNNNSTGPDKLNIIQLKTHRTPWNQIHHQNVHHRIKQQHHHTHMEVGKYPYKNITNTYTWAPQIDPFHFSQSLPKLWRRAFFHTSQITYNASIHNTASKTKMVEGPTSISRHAG